MSRPHDPHTLFSIFALFELTIVLIAFIAIVVPLPFGIKPQMVMSSSMEPVIPEGSIAWINESFEENDLKIGTIAVYEPTLGIDVLHRIVEHDGQTYRFKGDNNDAADLTTPIAEQIKGIYLFHIPLIGEAFLFFMDNKIIVIALFIGINVTLWLLNALLLRRKEHRILIEQGRRMLIRR